MILSELVDEGGAVATAVPVGASPNTLVVGPGGGGGGHAAMALLGPSALTALF
jgi:hypothetical protein